MVFLACTNTQSNFRGCSLATKQPHKKAQNATEKVKIVPKFSPQEMGISKSALETTALPAQGHNDPLGMTSMISEY